LRAEPLVDDDLNGEHDDQDDQDDQDGKQREYGRKEVGRQRTELFSV
jgi:hypothetical protein